VRRADRGSSDQQNVNDVFLLARVNMVFLQEGVTLPFVRAVVA
jgi:hypothetical protein